MVARLSPAALAAPDPAGPVAERDESSLSVGYGKWTAQLKGRETLLIALLLGLVAGQLWLMWTLVDHMDRQHAALLAESQVQSWLLSRPEAERPKLALPAALRGRLSAPE